MTASIIRIPLIPREIPREEADMMMFNPWFVGCALWLGVNAAIVGMLSQRTRIIDDRAKIVSLADFRGVK